MKHYHKNPRQITTKQAKDLKLWLAELGDLSGIVHDLNTDEIIGGNMRLEVMGLMKTKPTITETFDPPTDQGTVALGHFEHSGEQYAYRAVRWTPEQCAKANVVANKAGGDWDWDELANSFEVPDLLEWGFDESELQLDWGDDATPDPGAQSDRAAELQEKWNVSRGQVWQVGRHRVMCGDSTCAEDVGRLMDGERAAFGFADPPYGVQADEWDNEPFWDHDYLVDLCGIVGVTSGLKHLDWFIKHLQMPYVWTVAYYLPAYSARGALGFNNWSPCLIYSRDSVYRDKRDIVEIAITAGEANGEYHRGQKPPKFMVWIVELFTEAQEIVLDVFLGSGTTLVACEQTNRIGYGMEISEKYVAVSLERLSGMGLVPELIEG